MTGWREEGVAAAGLTPTVSSAVARVVIRLWPNLSELLCARVVPLTYSPPNTLASAANTHTRARMDRPPRHSRHPPLLLATDGSGRDPSGDTYRTCTGRPVRGACRSSTRMDATGSRALAMDSNIFYCPRAADRVLLPALPGGRTYTAANLPRRKSMRAACGRQTTCGRHEPPAREAGRHARRGGRGSRPPSGNREARGSAPPGGRAPTGAQLLAFERKGWVAQRGLFTPEEVAGYRHA